MNEYCHLCGRKSFVWTKTKNQKARFDCPPSIEKEKQGLIVYLDSANKCVGIQTMKSHLSSFYNWGVVADVCGRKGSWNEVGVGLWGEGGEWSGER